jgi:hypothetical protein
MKKDKYIGAIVDDYIVVEKLPNYYKSCAGYRIKCMICGHEKITTDARIREMRYEHSLMKCEETYLEKEVLNKTFGDMTVIGYKRNVGDRHCTNLIVKCNICGCERDDVNYTDFIIRHSGYNHNPTCARYQRFKEDNLRLYNIWSSMKKRCNNPNNENYQNYGGRGIKCLYDDFTDFYKDMYESYIEHCEKFGEKDTTIDRIDVNGNYEKGNIRWATIEEQSTNKRNNRLFKVVFPDGHIEYSNTIRGFTREHNLPFGSVRQTLNGRNDNHYKDWYFEYVDNL